MVTNGTNPTAAASIGRPRQFTLGQLMIVIAALAVVFAFIRMTFSGVLAVVFLFGLPYVLLFLIPRLALRLLLRIFPSFRASADENL